MISWFNEIDIYWDSKDFCISITLKQITRYIAPRNNYIYDPRWIRKVLEMLLKL